MTTTIYAVEIKDRDCNNYDVRSLYDEEVFYATEALAREKADELNALQDLVTQEQHDREYSRALAEYETVLRRSKILVASGEKVSLPSPPVRRVATSDRFDVTTAELFS